MKKILFFLLLMNGILDFNTEAQSLDSTFGTGGKVVLPVAGFAKGTSCSVKSIAVQSDGKIIAVGTAVTEVGTTTIYFKYCLLLFRFNSDGSLDSTFNGTGKVLIPGLRGKSVVIQKDGKIIVGSNDTFFHLCLLRFNASGALDTSFNKTGKLLVNCWSSDCKLILTGKSIFAGSADTAYLMIARINLDGTLDNKFGSGGFAIGFNTEDTRFPLPSIGNINILSNGDIILAGMNWDGDIEYPQPWAIIEKFDSLGNQYSNYDRRAYTAVNWYTGLIDYTPFAFCPKNDSLLLALGVGIKRFLANGNLDSSYGFAKNKILYGGFDDAILVDSSILASIYYNDSAFAFTRYYINGERDSAFGVKGMVKTPFGKNQSSSRAIAAQKDGKIILAGYSDTSVALARYVIPGLIVTAVTQPIVPQGTLKLYPNPFSYDATLEYTLAHEDNISINIYDMEGKLIRQILPASNMEKGIHRQAIHLGENIPSGSYFIMLNKGKESAEIKILKQYVIQISLLRG